MRLQEFTGPADNSEVVTKQVTIPGDGLPTDKLEIFASKPDDSDTSFKLTNLVIYGYVCKGKYLLR
jgi:hypothetical protein